MLTSAAVKVINKKHIKHAFPSTLSIYVMTHVKAMLLIKNY